MQSVKDQSQSIPGQWGKDTPKDTPGEEHNDPVDSQSVPRSAGAVVSEAGDIVDEAGNTIGKVTDSKNPQELAGNTVTAAGDIVNTTGDVLGRAVPLDDQKQSEYTTDGAPKKKSGFGLGSGLKSVYSTVGGGLNTVGSGLKGFGSRSNVDQTTPSTNEDDATERPVQQEEGQEENIEGESQINLEDQEQTDQEGLTEVPPEGTQDERYTDAPPSEIPPSEAPQSEIPQSEIPEDEIPEDEVPQSEAPKSEAPQSEVPQSEAPKSEVPQSEIAEDEAPASETAKSQPPSSEIPPSEAAKSEIPGEEEQQQKDVEAKEGEEEAGEEEAGEEQENALDYSALKGTKVNKAGNLVNDNGEIIGRVVEGDPKKLLGKKADENGDIWSDSGKKLGKGEPLPDSEREDLKKDFAPFENFPDAVVEADGTVTSEGKRVGTVVEGDPKRLKGSKVDEDGDILDRRGNVVGRAEAWDEPEAEPEQEVDNSMLAGKRVNKLGNVVDSNGQIFGRIIEGPIASLIGRMCDKDGNVRSESGDIIGRAELVGEGERDGSKDGPFSDLAGCTVAKEGKVVTAAGDVVGRLVSGDSKTLFGRTVDDDGDILDKNGNVIGKAERWEEPEKKKNPLTGRKVNREGNVVDEEGNIVGKLTSGDLNICSGKEIDSDGDVVNHKGQTIGHVSLLEDIPPEPEAEESAEDKAKREQAESDQKLAGNLAYVVESALDKIRPICKLITDKIDRAERTPKEELDEEQLVKDVKPLIEQGGKILSEVNGTIRGMDPDGRIQRQAKHKAATREATSEEFHLADLLKELTGTVTECIDNAKRKLEDMPHAKEELSPLWGLLAEPLFQILAAVGLLLNGVLGLVGRLLSGLGLGGIVDSILGGLGVNKILDTLGLGSVIGSLTGKKDKKK